MRNAVICAYARSAFTPAGKGALVKIRPDDLLAQVVQGLMSQVDIDPNAIEDLIAGCAFPEGEQGFNMARNIVFLANLPVSGGGATVNRFCGSSMESIHMAAGKIAMGAGEAFLATGVESMSRIPMGGFSPMPNPTLYANYPQAYMAMGITAENVARQFHIARRDQEEFALKSHQKAAKADFTKEIIPISKNGKEPQSGDNQNLITKDGCIRADTTLEAMATLKPAFDEKGTVTAATSSPLTDGAAVVLVCSEAFANEKKLPKLARITSIAVCGVEPEIMGIGPVEATRKALARAGIKASDLDVIELNEAFAAQSIACIRELDLDESKINLDGGAIALGHPLGASGARITGKAAQLLHKSGGKYALAAQCIGGGQGIATVLEKI